MVEVDGLVERYKRGLSRVSRKENVGIKIYFVRVLARMSVLAQY